MQCLLEVEVKYESEEITISLDLSLLTRSHEICQYKYTINSAKENLRLKILNMLTKSIKKHSWWM